MDKSARLVQCMGNVDFDQTTTFINELAVTGSHMNIMSDSVSTAAKYYLALQLKFDKFAVKHFSVGCSTLCDRCVTSDEICEQCAKAKQREDSLKSINLREISLVKKHATDDRTKVVDGQKQLWFMLCPNDKKAKKFFVQQLFRPRSVSSLPLIPFLFHTKNAFRSNFTQFVIITCYAV